jgi:hypothetical protein
MAAAELTLGVITTIADALTIVASGIAIWVFFTKKKEISAAFTLLLTWSYQTTLSEIIAKLDRLNEYNASDADEMVEIRNILHEIAGQFRGNQRLCKAAPTIPERLEALATGKRLTEPNKRSMVAEIREVIRNLKVEVVDPTSGE